MSIEGHKLRGTCGLWTLVFVCCSDQIKTTEQVYIELTRLIR
jgi:hypothetical protein